MKNFILFTKNIKNFFLKKGFSASADILLKSYKYRNSLEFYELPINLRYDLKQGQSKDEDIKNHIFKFSFNI